jgi:hypothetical protein
MLCTGCKTGANGGCKPVQKAQFLLVSSSFIVPSADGHEKAATRFVSMYSSWGRCGHKTSLTHTWITCLLDCSEARCGAPPVIWPQRPLSSSSAEWVTCSEHRGLMLREFLIWHYLKIWFLIWHYELFSSLFDTGLIFFALYDTLVHFKHKRC